MRYLGVPSGLAAGDGARSCREPRAADVGRASSPSSRSASSRRSARRSACPRSHAFPVSRHRLWQVAVDAASSRLPGSRPGTSASRATRPRYYDRYLEWDVVVLVVGDHAPRLRRVRLLQSLVAVRLDAGHVGRAARRHGRGHRGVSRLRAARLPSRRGSSRDLDRRPAPAPRLRHGRHGCSPGRSSRDRRRGRSSRAARRC